MQQVVIIDQAEFTGLMQRIETLEQRIATIQANQPTAVEAIVNKHAKNGRINGAGIRAAMGWSDSTLWRYVKDGRIPVTVESGRYYMDVNEFIQWYNTRLMIKQN